MKIKAFTLLEIMIVVAIIGLLAAIAIPNFYRVRQASQYNACLANLKQIDGAKASWAMENRKDSRSEPVGRDLYGPTAYIKVEPRCPAGGVYDIRAVSESPKCSHHSDIDLK